MKGPSLLYSFYLNKSVYYIGFAAAAVFVASYFIPVLFTIAFAILLFTATTLLVDALLLYSKANGITAKRMINDRLSNGDENKVRLELFNFYLFKVECVIIDELPFQFQERNWQRKLSIGSDAAAELDYTLQPTERGAYHFGNINVYISSPLKLVQRRYTFNAAQVVKVYPSYVQMRRYQLLAIGNKLQEACAKRVRKLGHSMEFEQIKEYVRGDDYRTINWKATARRGDVMVNNYTDERSQQIFCLINKGRIMKMPFDGMTLLDHAINASLILCNVAMSRQDKAGIITFAESLDTFLAADKKPTQLNLILEALYNQQTAFLEPDLEQLFSTIRNRITQRSLLVLFTNFESIEGLRRDLPFLKRIAHYHLLVVVFFENTELQTLLESKAKTVEDIYIKTIAEKYQYEKRLIVKELQQQGIVALLTPPQKLTINALNKYLELKNRQSI
jgi:uncharacterized protein (DUF58 family)